MKLTWLGKCSFRWRARSRGSLGFHVRTHLVYPSQMCSACTCTCLLLAAVLLTLPLYSSCNRGLKRGSHCSNRVGGVSRGGWVVPDSSLIAKSTTMPEESRLDPVGGCIPSSLLEISHTHEVLPWPCLHASWLSLQLVVFQLILTPFLLLLQLCCDLTTALPGFNSSSILKVFHKLAMEKACSSDGSGSSVQKAASTTYSCNISTVADPQIEFFLGFFFGKFPKRFGQRR